MVGDGPQNGAKLRAIRKRTGRTQEEIAEAAGIDQSYLSLLEKEARAASDQVLDALAAALDVPVDSILRAPRPAEAVGATTPGDAA